MAKQIAFTEYEAVVLLRWFLKSLSGETSRLDAIKSCSEELRRMAINSGIEIDSTYRNINGIRFQMDSMESAYRRKTIRKPATRLFAETVEIYRTDRRRFEKILREASIMTEKKDNESLFLAWLATKVSSSQLDELDATYKSIEEECKKAHIIKDSLFEYMNMKTSSP